MRLQSTYTSSSLGCVASSSISPVACVVPVSTLLPSVRHPVGIDSPMARLLGRTLPRPARAAAVCLRPSRAHSTKVEFVEIDLSEESPASSGGGGGSAGDAAAPVRMRRLEDAIHGVLVRRAAPDWLPFVPGGSYWVPPMSRPLGVADLLGAAVYTSREGGASVLTEEEAMCFTTVRGWPSSKYFVEGKFPHSVKRPRNDAIQTDDEEN